MIRGVKKAFPPKKGPEGEDEGEGGSESKAGGKPFPPKKPSTTPEGPNPGGAGELIPSAPAAAGPHGPAPVATGVPSAPPIHPFPPPAPTATATPMSPTPPPVPAAGHPPVPGAPPPVPGAPGAPPALPTPLDAIGHTATGKPIHAAPPDHPAYAGFSPRDHQDAAKAHRLEAAKSIMKQNEHVEHARMSTAQGDHAGAAQHAQAAEIEGHKARQHDQFMRGHVERLQGGQPGMQMQPGMMGGQQPMQPGMMGGQRPMMPRRPPMSSPTPPQGPMGKSLVKSEGMTALSTWFEKHQKAVASSDNDYDGDELPGGEPGLFTRRKAKDGGELEGRGKMSGEHSSRASEIGNPGPGKYQKLSEDDEPIDEADVSGEEIRPASSAGPRPGGASSKASTIGLTSVAGPGSSGGPSPGGDASEGTEIGSTAPARAKPRSAPGPRPGGGPGGAPSQGTEIGSMSAATAGPRGGGGPSPGGAPSKGSEIGSTAPATEGPRSSPGPRPGGAPSKGSEIGLSKGYELTDGTRVIDEEHARAIFLSRLRKGEEDITVGVGVPEPRPEPPAPMAKSAEWVHGMVHYSASEDDRIAGLLEKSSSFFFEPLCAPVITYDKPIQKSETCFMCKSTKPLMLTTCPHCGTGRPLEKAAVPVVRGLSERRMMRREDNLYLPNGGRIDE